MLKEQISLKLIPQIVVTCNGVSGHVTKCACSHSSPEVNFMKGFLCLFNSLFQGILELSFRFLLFLEVTHLLSSGLFSLRMTMETSIAFC